MRVLSPEFVLSLTQISQISVPYIASEELRKHILFLFFLHVLTFSSAFEAQPLLQAHSTPQT
jgi:hypothetical protein